jgi:hypothetical protein
MEEEPKKEKRYCPDCGKRCYSEREANSALKAAKRGTSTRMSGKTIVIRSGSKNIPKRKYFCKYCGTYHLTHLPYYKVRREKKEYE